MKMIVGDAAGHPTPAEVEAFLGGHLSGPRAWNVLDHWLRCPVCCEGANPLGRPKPARDAGEHAAHERQVETCLASLRRGVDPMLELEIRGPSPIEARLARSWELRFTAPRVMLRFAQEAATEALSRLRAEDCGGAARREDLRCRVLAELGNAYRVNDRLRAAQEALGRAHACFLRGTGDELLQARLLDVEATLMADQGQHPLAQELLNRQLEIVRQLGNPGAVGRILISKAKYFIDAKEPLQGIALSQQALRLIDARQDPDLELAARFNLSWALAEAGDFRAARRSVWRLAPRFRERGHLMSSLRSRWLEGKIQLGLRDPQKAAREFTAVRDGFAAQDLPYDSSLVSLELAVALRELGCWAEAQDVLVAAMAKFHQLALSDYFRLSLVRFRELFETRRVRSTLLIEHVAFLRQLNEDAKRDGLRKIAAWRWQSEREDELDRRERDET